MSLLMEALRKAELAKRKMQQEEQAARDAADKPAAPSFTLEEREPGVTPQYIRETFIGAQNGDASDASHDAQDEPGDDALADAAELYSHQAAHRSTHQSTQPQQRAAAASVFAAKRKPARDRRALTILVTILLLMLPLGGGVLWYLQSATTSSIGLNPALANYDLSPRRADDAASDTPAAAPALDTVATDAIESTDTEADETADAADATPALAATGDDDETQAAVAATETPATPEPDVAATTAAPAPPAPVADASASPDLALPASAPAPVLEISRSRGTPQVNPDLVSAYARLQEGDIAGAGTLYRQVLAALPNNRDALLGLALVHMREGQPANARELYARLLQLNPRDPLAHTGLLQTMQGGSPIEHENTLKQLQAQYPNVAQLTLALGNHYAAQGRWSEAQAAYYNALLTARRTSNGPVHPDYAFNLAVSLEQLNQPAAALDYYRQAQALAADVRPGFDLQLLNNRLDFLLLEQSPR